MRLAMVVLAAALVLCVATSSMAAMDGNAKYWKGVTWYQVGGSGTWDTPYTTFDVIDDPLNPGNTILRNTCNTNNGYHIWLNGPSGGNVDYNKSFFEQMRSSSYSTMPTFWMQWTVRYNEYSIGNSQMDMVFNGVGGTAASVTTGTLAGWDPKVGGPDAAFGGDRASVGALFNLAYGLEHKGTALPNTTFDVTNAGGKSAWQLGASATVDSVSRTGGNYNVADGDVVTYTIGKRPDGTLDVWIAGPQIIGLGGNPVHLVDTMATDNPWWYLYQIEFRARGTNPGGGPYTQDFLDFQYGNNWAADGSGPIGAPMEQPALPEPATLGLVGLGLLAALRRR